MPHGLLVARFARDDHTILVVFGRRSRPTRSVFMFLGHAPRMASRMCCDIGHMYIPRRALFIERAAFRVASNTDAELDSIIVQP